MGRLEKQIRLGALALVGVLVAVGILKGLAPQQEGDEAGQAPASDWSGGTPPLMLGTDGSPLAPAANAAETSANDAYADPLLVDLGASAEQPAPAPAASLLPADPALSFIITPPAPDLLASAPAATASGAYIVKKGDNYRYDIKL